MVRRNVIAVVSIPLSALLLAHGAVAQQAEDPVALQRGGEPEVKHIVVEDDNARIDELRVRGITKSITVYPKNGAKPYEIEPLDPTRSPPNSADGARLAGKRVWNILSF